MSFNQFYDTQYQVPVYIINIDILYYLYINIISIIRCIIFILYTIYKLIYLYFTDPNILNMNKEEYILFVLINMPKQ